MTRSPHLIYSDSPEVDFSRAREMRPYLTEPKAMYVGCPGKHGYLQLGFELDADGKSILRHLDRRAHLIVQQELYFDATLPQMPCVYILSSGGPNVDGDRYRQDISVGKDAMAWISTGAATKLASMKYNYSGMVQHITLDQGAYLEYLPEPIIPHARTRYISDTTLTVHPTATMVYSEIYMAGRKYYQEGELFKFDILSICSHARRPDGRQLFREKFIIDPGRDHIRDCGVMGSYDVFANVIAMMPEDKAAQVYAATEPFIDRERRLAAGVTHLPGGAGLLFKVLGMEPGPVKETVRRFCSSVRMAVKGVPLPDEFPWR